MTFSLLSRFLCCRERFKLLVVDGWGEQEQFNHRIEFGSMWHVCEENFPSWQGPLLEYCRGLSRKYPLSREGINDWYEICKLQFKAYTEFWATHPEWGGKRKADSRKVLSRETTFNVPYILPSGRVVRIRGKRDGEDLVGDVKRGGGVYLWEHKTKGEVVPEQLERQLLFDLQTMLYVVAYLAEFKQKYPFKGLVYNVVRRPLAGGRYSIKQKQDETKGDFYERLREIIEGDPEHFFFRWQVEIHDFDVEKFKQQSLNPILEQLLDWWDEVNPPAKQNRAPNYYTPMHFRMPYGVYNPLLEGAIGDLDVFMDRGNSVGLSRTSDLFPELSAPKKT